MPPPSDPTDISSFLFAHGPLALSRTQRLVSSWLPPPTEAELNAARAPSEVEKEEDGVFAPSSELSGLGAKYTEEDESVSRILRSDEKLKLQLLGRDWMKRQERKGGAAATAPSRLGSRPKPAPMTRPDPVKDESEDEGGRSSLGKVKSLKYTEETPEGLELAEDADDVGEKTIRAGLPDITRSCKRPRSYLDEVLAQKAQKEQMKQRRKKQRSNAVDKSNNSANP